MEQEPKVEKGVEVTFGESERKPGEKIDQYLASIKTFLNEIREKFNVQFSVMEDSDKQILEERLAVVRSELMKIHDELE